MDAVAGIDSESGDALHRQVYTALRSAILTGRLGAGCRLPATRVLAEQLSVSRSTVADAYEQLQSEGYIEGRHGSGTYVAPNLPQEGVTRRAAHASNGFDTPLGLKLSRWGSQVVATGDAAWLGTTGNSDFTFDFRPHRVATDMFPWEVWRAGVDRALNTNRDALSYVPPAGHPGLQEAIAAHVARHRGVVCTPQQVVIVNGTQQGLNLLAQLLLDRGERVAVEDPGYPAARHALEARGLRVSRIPVDRNGIVIDTFCARDAFRLVYVTPSHQDPTGATLSLPRRLALLDHAHRTGCIVFEDDYDSEFRYEGRPVESLQGLDRGDLVVYAGTFSKSVLSGLRLGFLVLPPRLVQPFIAAKSVWDSGAPMLEQLALLEFMRSGSFEKHVRRMRRIYRARRDALVHALDRSFGTEVQVGERHGGLNMLVQLPTFLPSTETVARAGAAGIGLRSAESYYEESPTGTALLMGFAAMQEASIDEGVERLAHVLRA